MRQRVPLLGMKKMASSATGRRANQQAWLLFALICLLGTVQFLYSWSSVPHFSSLPSREWFASSSSSSSGERGLPRKESEKDIVTSREADNANAELNLRQTEAPVEKIETEPSVMKEEKKKFVYLHGGFGRSCNQLLVLAAGIERAIRDGFVAVIRPSSFPAMNDLDIDYFQQAFADNIRLVHGKDEENIDGIMAPVNYWCGLKTNIESIRKGFRPKPDFRHQAENDIERMREIIGPDTDLVSFHIRHYDGLCAQKLPDSCEWRQNYQFKPFPYGCNQTLTEDFVKYVQSDWPDYPWNQRKMAVYLSTDRQSKITDESYTIGYKNIRGISHVLEPTAKKTTKYWNEYKPGPHMMQDMWASVLTDFHVGMPRSSCDKIVAEWRAAEGRPLHRVHPRACYDGYSSAIHYPRKNLDLTRATSLNFEKDEDRSLVDMCPYVRRIGFSASGLSNPGSSICATCQLILAFGAALSKAMAQGMGIHVYEQHGAYIRDHFDWEAIGEVIPFLFYREREDEELLFGRVHLIGSGKYRATGLAGGEQAQCAKGEPLEALRSGRFVPKKAIRDAVSTFAQLPSVSYVPSCSDKQQSYCSKTKTESCEDRPRESNHEDSSDLPHRWSHVHRLWALVLAKDVIHDPSSPCSQVVALWRASLGRGTPHEHSHCCVGGYFAKVSKESPSLYEVTSKVSRPSFFACPST